MFEALSDINEDNDVIGFSAAISACESGEVFSLDHDLDENCEEMTLKSQELANVSAYEEPRVRQVLKAMGKPQ
eukprot:11395761-Karenia_brevis.AAC.1